MNFTDLILNKLDTASQTLSAINAFGEYITSKFNDLANFMSGYGNYASVYISKVGSSITNVLTRISNEQYVSACEEPDKIFKLIIKDGGSESDPGSYIEATGREITDAFEDQLSELRCQEQYLNYCLSVDNATSTDFMVRIRSLCPNIAGVIADKYANLIEISGSALDCLKNFFTLFKPNSIQYTNQTISLVNYLDYTGNIWQAAWEHVVDTVSGFFENVWKGLQDLGGFLQRLLGAILKFGKWFISKAFHELSTYYDKGSSAAAGIMDLPLFQIYGTKAKWQTFFNSEFDTAFSWDGYNHRLIFSRISSVLADSMEYATRDRFEGVNYLSVCEVIIPSKPCDISIRIGKTNTDDIVLQAYIVSDYGTWSGYDDADNNRRIYDSLLQALKFVSSVIPIVNTPQLVDDTSIKWNELTQIFIDYASISSSELAQILNVQTRSIDSAFITSNAQLKCIIAGIVTYACLMSKGFINSSVGQDITDVIIEQGLFDDGYNLYPVPVEYQSIINELDDMPIDITEFNKLTFKPYAKRNQLPVTIHYQTTSERGQEIVNAILKVVVAVVAIVATIKIIKWTRKRNKDTALAHANVDRLSWDVAANPSPENMGLFSKAWSKAKRMDFVNGILGLSTGSGTGVITSAIGTLTNMLGKNTSDSASSLSNISDVQDDVLGVRRLIKDS